MDLNIIFNKIGEIICDNNNIKNLYLNNLKITTNRMKTILDYLRHINKCIRIDFSKNLIDDEGFQTILEYQKMFSDRFQHIIVPFNKLSIRIFGMLLDHLKSQNIVNLNNNSQNNKIQEIVLDGVNCHQNFDIGDFFIALSQFQPKIQNLSLCNMQIKDFHAQKINQFIKNSLYLEDFNISFNELKDNGAKIIIEGAWSNQNRFSRLTLLGNYFTKQFSSQIQQYQNRNAQKIQILIEPTLVNSHLDQQQNGLNNFPSQDQVQPMNQIRSSLGALNDEDPDMPMVEHSVKHDELSNFIIGNGLINPIDNPPFLSPSNSPFSNKFNNDMHIQSQQQQQPYSQINSKNIINSIDYQELPQQQNFQMQSKQQMSQTSIPNELKDKHQINFQNPPSNYQMSVEEFNINPNQQQRSNIELKSQKDNMTFGVNSIGNNNYRLDTYKVVPQNKDQQQINSKSNTQSGIENSQVHIPENVEEYIRQIHQIETHIKDLFEKQTVLVEEIKQKISQQPLNGTQGLHSQSRQNVSQLSSYKSLPKESQNHLTDRKDGLNSAASKYDSRPQTYQNLPSDSFFNLDDPEKGKAKTYTLFGQYGYSSEQRKINPNLSSQQRQVQNLPNQSKTYYSTASNNHLPRTQFSSRDFTIPESQVSSDAQQVAHSLTVLQEKIQDLEEKLVIDSHRHLQDGGIIDQREQISEEKVLRSKNNGIAQYQKKSPSSINGSTINEIPSNLQQGVNVNGQKTQQTMTSIPTENNISQLAIPQNLNKYSTKYKPQMKNRPNSVQKMPSNVSIQSQLKLPSEDNQDRKLSIISIIQSEAHIDAPNVTNLRQSRGVQNGDNEKVKHTQMNRPQSQQKQGPVSMVQMEEVNINVNQSPQKQMIYNEQRINQDIEIQQFLNNQQQQLQSQSQQTQQGYSSQNYNQGYQLHHPDYEQIKKSPIKVNQKQQIISGSQYSGANTLNSQAQTLQSSPYQSGMKNSFMIGNKNLSFAKRRDNVKYLVEELIKSIDRYEYLIQMCSELKQIKKKVHDNIGGSYPYNQINNNNLLKLCGVESDLRDKMRSQEKQIYDSINELRDIGLVIDESKLSNWDNLKEVLSSAAIEYEKNNIDKQGDFSNYKLSDQIIDKSLQNSVYQNTSHKKSQSYYTQNYEFHS